jgi:hypothetical protein
MSHLEEEELSEIIRIFWEQKGYDERLERKLFLAHIERECERGIMKYKNGRNLKDGLDIIDQDNVSVFNPAEMYEYLSTKNK